MQYLAQWRTLRATNRLAGSSAPRARVAEEVGYQTDTAFKRASSCEYGIAPAAWRRRRVSPATMTAT